LGVPVRQHSVEAANGQVVKNYMTQQRKRKTCVMLFLIKNTDGYNLSNENIKLNLPVKLLYFN